MADDTQFGLMPHARTRPSAVGPKAIFLPSSHGDTPAWPAASAGGGAAACSGESAAVAASAAAAHLVGAAACCCGPLLLPVLLLLLPLLLLALQRTVARRADVGAATLPPLHGCRAAARAWFPPTLMLTSISKSAQ